MKLLNDVARCDGLHPHGESWGECEKCARRTATRPKFTWFMPPPDFIGGKCPERIEEAN